MEIKLKIIEDQDSELWDDAVRSSSYGTLFHTWKWLKLVEKYSKSKLYPIMAFSNDITIGIYPIFFKRKISVNMAFSPPPSFLLYLGPLILNENSKQDKKENIFINFQEKVDDFLFSELKCKYVRIASSPGLYDCRPFIWNGYRTVPKYTYRIDLSKGIDEVWKNFDRKLRVDINRANREGIIVEEGNKKDLEFIHSSVSKRFRDQGLEPTLPDEYLGELFDEFHPQYLKIFVARYKGDNVGGMISLLYKNIIYLWEGVIKTDLKGISPNDFVQWKTLQWACNNDYIFYENISGGDVRRLMAAKSKYNPEPSIWFTMTKTSSYFYRTLEIIFTDILPKIKKGKIKI